MVEAFMQWDVPTTLQMAQDLEPFGLSWIEEPLPPDDIEGYAQLAEQSPIPIAGGEHEYTARGFAELIDRRLHHVLQPDVCWCGGLTELVKIYRQGQAAGLRVCPHRGSEAWSLPAIAAQDSQPLAEWGRPWMHWLRGQPEPRDGQVRPCDRPGFGVDVDSRIWE